MSGNSNANNFPTPAPNEPAEKTRETEPSKSKPRSQAKKGPGKIKVGPRTYTLITRPLGEESYECIVNDGTAEVVVNSDHPSFEVVRNLNPMDQYLFRMVVNAITCLKMRTGHDVYEAADALFRRPVKIEHES